MEVLIIGAIILVVIIKKVFCSVSSDGNALFRTTHGLMSGDITPQGHIPSSSLVTKDGKSQPIILQEKMPGFFAYCRSLSDFSPFFNFRFCC